MVVLLVPFYLTTVRLSIETIVFELGSDSKAGKVIVYTGDCLPAIQGLLKLKGSVDVFPEVKQMFRFAAVHDVELDFIWLPREADAMLHADMLSKMEDSSEIFLSHRAFHRACMPAMHTGWHLGLANTRCLCWGSHTVTGQHVVSRYYTLYCTPHALAANAMNRSWQHDACVPNRAGLLWVFPPAALIGAVISKLLVEQVDATVVLPRYLRFWTAMLQRLPIVASCQLSYYSKLYTIGSRAPKYMQGHGKDKPIYLFNAYLVRFN